MDQPPIAAPVLQAPDFSGAAKRRRRNELPAPFILVSKLNGDYFVFGVVVWGKITPYAAAGSDGLEAQYLNLLTRHGIPDPHEYVVWHADSVAGLVDGPMRLVSNDLKHGGLASKCFSQDGEAKILDAKIVFGGEECAVQDLVPRPLRGWHVEASLANSVASGEVLQIVTSLAHIQHAGLKERYLHQCADIAEAAAPPPIEEVHDVVPVEQDSECEDEGPCVEETLGPATTGKPHGFDILTSAMRLSMLMRNPEHIKAAVKASATILCGQEEGARFSALIDADDIQIPSRQSLAHAWNRLDVAEVIWSRQTAESYQWKRYLTADASTKLYEFFCIRETAVGLPKARGDHARFNSSEWQSGFSSKPWQCTVLGYGASTVAYKFRNLAHALLLHCDPANLREYRESVYGWTSDQAVERKLADVAFAVDGSYEELRILAQSVRNLEVALSSEESRSVYMFPNCLLMPGHQHILMNGLEEAVKKSAMWNTEFYNGLEELVRVLNQRQLRQRFVATCMGDATASERKTLGTFTKQHLDWRWESLGFLCNELIPVLPILLKYWDLKKISGEASETLGTINVAVITAADKFLQRKWLEPCLEILRSVGGIVNQWSSWLEGCACHEDIWTGPGSHAQKVEKVIACLCGKGPRYVNRQRPPPIHPIL